MNRLTFTEFEAFAEMVRAASLTFRQCSMEVPNWTLHDANVGSIRIQKGFVGGGAIAEGATGTDVWSFYHQSHLVHANGRVMNTDEVFAAPPGSEFCLACKPSHEWILVIIPTSLLSPSRPELDFPTFGNAHVLKPPPHVTRRFASLVRHFLSCAESRPLLLDSSLAVDAYRNELLSAAKELFTPCQRSASPHFARWQGQTKSAVALAMSHPDQSVSVSDLARQSGVPERTLRTAFQRYYGLSPAEYLRIHRLHQARRLLRSSRQGETTVTQIAFELGFWDLGRFAGAYRQLFRERPSETLRQPVRVSVGERPHQVPMARG